MNFPGIADLESLADPAVMLIGMAVFAARIFNVSIGTVRTIVTVQGRTVTAFSLAVFEVTTWITVVSTVIQKFRRYRFWLSFIRWDTPKAMLRES